MSHIPNFKEMEKGHKGDVFDWDTAKTQLKFDDQGLIPAIAQQYDSGEVLMMAWMNAESLEESLQTGRVCYWSRSRKKLWRKGEESGQVQILKEARIDCDGDALLLLVDQTGPACHTGRKSCFFFSIETPSVVIKTEPLIDPADLYAKKPK